MSAVLKCDQCGQATSEDLVVITSTVFQQGKLVKDLSNVVHYSCVTIYKFRHFVKYLLTLLFTFSAINVGGHLLFNRPSGILYVELFIVFMSPVVSSGIVETYKTVPYGAE